MAVAAPTTTTAPPPPPPGCTRVRIPLTPTPLLAPKLTLNIAASSSSPSAGPQSADHITSTAAVNAAHTAGLVIAAVQRINANAAARNAAVRALESKGMQMQQRPVEVVECAIVVNVGYGKKRGAAAAATADAEGDMQQKKWDVKRRRV